MGAADAEAAAVHQGSCADCRMWAEAAHVVTRRARLTPATPIPDLSASIVARLAAETASQPHPSPSSSPTPPTPTPARLSGLIFRVGLVGVGGVLLAVAVPGLLAQGSTTAVHTGRELGSWDAALAVGMVFAAWRPARAQGMLPLLGAVAALLLVTTGIDVAQGRVPVAHEAQHVLTLLGLGLVWVAGRRSQPSAGAAAPTPTVGRRALA